MERKASENVIATTSSSDALLSRPARPAEAGLMQQLYQEELAYYARNPKQTTELLSVGEFPIDQHIFPTELAAWTVVAGTIIYIDKMTVKR